MYVANESIGCIYTRPHLELQRCGAVLQLRLCVASKDLLLLFQNLGPWLAAVVLLAAAVVVLLVVDCVLFRQCLKHMPVWLVL